MQNLRSITSTRNPEARDHRGGFNLAELLFGTTALSGLTVLAMTVVGLLITAEQHTAESLWVDVTISNLAVDLQQDAHRARDLTVVAGDPPQVSVITFAHPQDVQVTYECTPEKVVRRETHNGKVRATDSYRLAFGSSWFVPPTENGLLTWTHQRRRPSIGGYSQPTPVDAAPRQTYQVRVAVGLLASRKGGQQP